MIYGSHTASINYQRPFLYPKQLAAIFEPKRYSLIEASTKSGKTAGSIVWIIEQALQYPAGHNCWWIAPVSIQAYIAFDRCRRALGEECRAFMSPYRIVMPTGSVIWFKSGDKPDCYDSATEILTKSGWKHFNELSAVDVVMTRSKEGRAEWQAPTRIIAQPYAGEMVTVENKRIDLCITPNHRMLIERRRGNHGRGKWDRSGPRLGKVTLRSEMVTSADSLLSADTMPSWCEWDGLDSEEWTSDRCALLGFYLAEGSAIGNCSEDPSRLTKRCGYRIHFAQTAGSKGGDKGDVRQQFCAVLSRLGYRWRDRRDGMLVWDKALWTLLIGLGNKYTKFVPEEVKNLPADKLKNVLKWMVLGDGTSNRGNHWTYFTVSKRLADDVQEMVIKCGWNAIIKERASKPYGRVGAKASGATGYLVKIQKHGRSHFLKGSRSYLGRTAYAGMVYCVSVPNAIVLVRRNGKPAWSGNSLYGEDVYAAVVDEASRLKEGAWFAIRSTLTATRGRVRIVGNVKGRRGWFYRLARRAEQGGEDMAYHRITAYDAVQAGVLAAEEIEDAKRLYPEHVFRELYMAEASDDGGNPFGLPAIKACTVAALHKGVPAVWGWDLAKSVDWTVGIGMTWEGYVCRLERWQHTPWEETVNRILRVTARTNALVDSTGVGDPILETLQRRSGREPGSDGQQYEGYKFTGSSKQQLMEGLAVSIQSHGITFPAGPIADELEVFEFQMAGSDEGRYTGIRYSAPSGFHDDCVMALALADMHRQRSKRPIRWSPEIVRELQGAPRMGRG